MSESATDDDQLRQKLLELLYKLLPDDESAELWLRVERDPETAALLEDVRRTRLLFAEAARLPLADVTLQRPQDDEATVSEKVNDAAALGVAEATSATPAAATTRPARSVRTRRRRYALMATTAVAVLLVGLTVSLWTLGGIGPLDPSSNYAQLVLATPGSVTEKQASSFTVQVREVNGESPEGREVEYAIYSEAGEQLVGDKVTIGPAGRAQVPLPTDKLPDGARLEVNLEGGDASMGVSSVLAVRPEQTFTTLEVDRPSFGPGDTLRFRSVSLGRASLMAAADTSMHFHVTDPQGDVLHDSPQVVRTRNGVGFGSCTLGTGLPAGKYTLIASADGVAPFEERLDFQVRPTPVSRTHAKLAERLDRAAEGEIDSKRMPDDRRPTGAAPGDAERLSSAADPVAPAAPAVRPVEVNLDGASTEDMLAAKPHVQGEAVIDFYPEGGDLVGGLDNRVYFAARDGQGRPLDVQARLVDTEGDNVAAFESAAAGRGVFRFRPSADETYTVQLDQPADVTITAPLPQIESDIPVVLSVEAGVIAAREPLEVHLGAARSNVPLLATVSCRGVQVAQQPVVTRPGPQKVVLPLPDSAAGVLQVTVFDYSDVEPLPLAERLVYRRPVRKLNVNVTLDDAGADQPDPTQLAQQNRNEVPSDEGANKKLEGRKSAETAADAAASVPREHNKRVWEVSAGDRVDVQLDVRDELDNVADAVLGVRVVDASVLDDVQQPTGLAATNYLASELADPRDLTDANLADADENAADASLDLLLGTQGWRRFVHQQVDGLVEATEGDGNMTAEDEQARDKAIASADREERNATATVDEETRAGFAHARERLVALDGRAATPVVADNLAEVSAAYEAAVAETAPGRTASLGAMAFLGALGLLALVGLLATLRLLRGFYIWLPPLGVALACGLMAMLVLRQDAPSEVEVAGVSFEHREVAGGNVEPDAPETAKSAELPPTEDLKKKNLAERWPSPRGPAAAEEQVVEPQHSPPADAPSKAPASNARTERKQQGDQSLKADEQGEANGQRVPAQATLGARDGVGNGADRDKDRAAAPDSPPPARRQNGGFKRDRLPEARSLQDARPPEGRPASESPAPAQPPAPDAFNDKLRALADEASPVPGFGRFAQTSGDGEGAAADYPSTLYWNPLLVTADGMATFSFDVPEGAGAYLLFIDAHGTGDSAGRLGAAAATIRAR